MKSHPSLFLIFYFLFLINLSSWVSAAHCSAHQSSLLLKLKHGFSFQSDSKRLSSWIPGSSDCCLWEGLTCDNSTGLVIGLDLSTGPSQIEDWISGEIDPSLFQLHSLETLDLSGNNFYLSPIPSGLGNLTRLTHLNLANAGFSGQIPLEISRLTRLLSLDLSQNSLNTENPNLKTLFHNLTALQELHLDYVDISGDGNFEWSKAISSSLHNLRVLSLVECLLSGAIDESLLRLPFLTQLLLDGNVNLSSLNNESFSNYTSIKLRHFNLSRCGLSGQFPENIFLLPNLITLDISMNINLTGSFPSFFPTNNSLEFLYLHVTMLNGTLPESMGNLKSLKILNLDTCDFWGPIPSSLKDLTQLDTLDLANNNFNGQIPPLSSPSIAGIDLSHNHLTGAIPPSLLALPSLQTLDLSHNQLMGSIPTSIVHLPSLQTLDLSHNQLMGSIPSSITDLIQLIELDLSYNNFNGTIDIGLLQNLKDISTLYLSGNNFTLVFDNASISGTGFHFPRITILGLGSCNIKEFPGFLHGKKLLKSLDLSDNKLEGDIPSWIWKLGGVGLENLNLSRNMLTGIENPNTLSSMFSMYILDLHSNDLEGFLTLPPAAMVLDFSNNKFSHTIPFNIGQSLQYTRFFSLSNNKFTGEIPTSICNYSELDFLDLSNNNFNGSIPNCLATSNTFISVLKLRGNNLHGTIPDGFINRCNLRTLDLNSNRLIGPIPRSLANCTMLEVLDLGYNYVNDTFPSWLHNLPQLRVLVLRSNQLHGVIEQQVQIQLGFQALQIIDISSNNLIGNLPKRVFNSWKGMIVDEEVSAKNNTDYFLQFTTVLSEMYYQDVVTVTSKWKEMQFVKILTTFCVIDFSNNRFNGSIPEELGILTSLRVLNLSRNVFKGIIAQSFGNLSNIESMDLSNNYLSGKIPTELTGLTFLSVFDVSHNRLYGRIPEGNQFSTFSSALFEGNQGLCGFPLSLECKTPPPTPTGNGETMEDKEGFDWELYLMAGLGYLGGLGFALGISCSRRWERDCWKGKWIGC